MRVVLLLAIGLLMSSCASEPNPGPRGQPTDATSEQRESQCEWINRELTGTRSHASLPSVENAGPKEKRLLLDAIKADIATLEKLHEKFSC